MTTIKDSLEHLIATYNKLIGDLQTLNEVRKNRIAQLEDYIVQLKDDIAHLQKGFPYTEKFGEFVASLSEEQIRRMMADGTLNFEQKAILLEMILASETEAKQKGMS